MKNIVRSQGVNEDSDYIIETDARGKLIIAEALQFYYLYQLNPTSHFKNESKLNDIINMQNAFKNENVVRYKLHPFKCFHQLILEDVNKNYLPSFTEINGIPNELFSEVFDVGKLISFKISIPVSMNNRMEKLCIDRYNIASISFDKYSENRLLTEVTLNLTVTGSYIKFLYKKSTGEISSALLSDSRNNKLPIKFISISKS